MWASSSSRHCRCPIVGCRCPQPSTRRVLCAPRTVRAVPREARHAGLGSAGDLCGRCELVAGWLQATLSARAALTIVGGQCWRRSADSVASAALPSRGPEAAASGASGIGLRRRCTDAAVGMRRGVACRGARGGRGDGEPGRVEVVDTRTTSQQTATLRRSDVAREIASKACAVREARRHRPRLPRRHRHHRRRRNLRRRNRRRRRHRRRHRIAVTTSLVPLCSPLGRAHAVRPRCGHPAAAHAVMRHPTPSHRATAAVAAVAVAAVARAAPPARQPTSKQDPPHRPAKPPLRARATVAAHHDTSDFGPWPHRGACARPTLRPEHGSACCARCQRRRCATLRARWACAAPQHARGYRHAHRRRRPRAALTFARVDAAAHGYVAASPRGLGLACGGASTPRARPGAAARAPRRHSRRRWCGHAATHAATRARALLGASGAVLTRWQLVGARVAAASAARSDRGVKLPRCSVAAGARVRTAEATRVPRWTRDLG